MNNITTNREFFSEFLVKQTRVGSLWEAVAPLPGGLGGRPLRCRATGPSGASAEIFVERPLPPRSGATRSRPPGSRAVGVFFCKFRKRKYIFVKNKNKKIKNRLLLSVLQMEVLVGYGSRSSGLSPPSRRASAAFKVAELSLGCSPVIFVPKC